MEQVTSARCACCCTIASMSRQLDVLAAVPLLEQLDVLAAVPVLACHVS